MIQFIRVAWLVLCFVVLAGQTFGEKMVCLKHDDNSQESKRSMTGAGHAVRFECPDDEKWYVKALSVHGSRYGTPRAPNEDFQVLVASDDLQRRIEVKKPYSLFKRGKEKWVRFGIDPVEVQGAFNVALFFNPTRTKGVYVGIDTDASPTHSAAIVGDEPEKEQTDLEGDWMIRVYVTKELEGEARQLVDDASRAEQLKSEEAARDAEILGKARSLTLKQDTGPMDDHMNIQGALYTVALETPKHVEGYVWQVQVYASQFGSKHDSEAVSGDVYVLDEKRKVLSRTTFPYSLATQQKTVD